MTTQTLVVWRVVQLATGVVASGPLAQSSGATADSAVNAYLDAMPADLTADQAPMIDDAMQFNDKDAAAFWPVYKMYQAEQAKLDEERVQLVKRYTDHWPAFTDAEARDLIEKSLALENRRADLRTQYFDRFNTVSPGVTVAKFFQLEHRLDLLVDMKIASELPSLLVRRSATPSEARPPTPK